MLEQELKIAVAIAPGMIQDNAAFTSNVIDLNDFDGAGYLEFIGVIGSIDASMAVLKVQESDTKTDATTLGGTPADVVDATTKPGTSDDNTVFVIGLDLRSPRKRYVQLQATAGDGAAGTYFAAIAVGRPGTSGSGATERGLLFAQYA